MALEAVVRDRFGRMSKLYIRVNSMGDVQNHGAVTKVLFRGYASQQAFEERAEYLFEEEIGLMLDVSKSPWDQAYAAARTLPPLDPPVPPVLPADPAPMPPPPTLADPPALPPGATKQEQADYARAVLDVATKRQTMLDVWTADKARQDAKYQQDLAEHDIAVTDHAKEVRQVELKNELAAALSKANDLF